MPTTWNGMTRELVEGIPVWRNKAGELFLYDQDLTKAPVRIGTAVKGFAENWQELMEPHLNAYRAAAAARPRGGASTSKN